MYNEIWVVYTVLTMCFLRKYLPFLWLLLLAACEPSDQKPHQLIPAFYYWQTRFHLSPTETRLLKQAKVDKLYIRFFDVDWDNQRRQPMPKAVLQFRMPPPVATVVPVVFITNRTLRLASPATVSLLAKKIAQKIQQMAKQAGIRPAEIQLDCDWTGTTRERYFALLRTLKKEIDVSLSATIRLHQIKYVAQTGIPPVDRGMLMFYNMADWKQVDTRNSIYDLDVADRYTSYLNTYPLPLDVVMPLFRWTVVYRNNRFLTLLNNVDRRQLVNKPFLQMQADSNRFVARNDTVAFGLSIRRGDHFRAEACAADNLLKGKAALFSKIQNEKSTFALYHLDTTVLNHYNYAFLKSLFQSIP